METLNKHDVLIAEEVAELLRIPIDSLYKALRKPDNEIPFMKIGKQYRFSRTEIMKKMKGENN